MSAGLLHSAQSLLASLAGLAHTRIELFSTEVQEALARLAAALLGALVVVMLAALGLGFGAAAMVVAAGEGNRLTALSIVAGFFLAAAVAGAFVMRHLAHAKPRVFDATLSELQRDYEALKP